MGKRIKVGERLPFFQYDTPYSEANSFRELLARQAPLVLVFMSNFGHPVTRTFVSRYSHTHFKLKDGGFAMVVRSEPARLAPSIGPGTLPFPLLCDVEGVLYDYLDIPTRTGFWRTCSLEAWQIIKKARNRGYEVSMHAAQQMPLTLILDADGTVLFCHYGNSLTDVPADCGAMQELLDELDLLATEGDDTEEEAEAGPARRLRPAPVSPEDGDGYDDGEAAPEDNLADEEEETAEFDTPADGEEDWDDSDVKEYHSPRLSQTFLQGLLDDPYDD